MYQCFLSLRQLVLIFQGAAVLSTPRNKFAESCRVIMKPCRDWLGEDVTRTFGNTGFSGTSDGTVDQSQARIWNNRAGARIMLHSCTV